MPEDAKLKVIAKRSGQLMTHVVTVWLCILDAASRHKTRGTVEVDSEEIAVVQEIDQPIVESILAAFYEKNMIDQNHRLSSWETRQYATSSERVSKHRATKKQDVTDGNALKRDVTTGNKSKHKNSKKPPDTDNRLQTADSDKIADKEKDLDKNFKAREEKEEREKEKQQSCGKAEKSETQILTEMVDIWNAEVQSKITPDQKTILTHKRKELLTARWIDEFAEDIRAWRYFCEIIGKSEFCLGKIEGKDWTIDLTWAIQSSDRVAKILEGGFSGGKHPPKPPACNLPEFADGWDDVIRRMEHHHGRAAIRSWFSNTVITAAEVAPDGALLTLACPREFVRGWVENHYLTDLNHCWNEQSICSRPVVGVQLTIREEKS